MNLELAAGGGGFAELAAGGGGCDPVLQAGAGGGDGGAVGEPSAWCMKHPPRQMIDRDARLALEEFIVGAVAKAKGGVRVRG